MANSSVKSISLCLDSIKTATKKRPKTADLLTTNLYTNLFHEQCYDERNRTLNERKANKKHHQQQQHTKRCMWRVGKTQLRSILLIAIIIIAEQYIYYCYYEWTLFVLCICVEKRRETKVNYTRLFILITY